MSLRPSHRPSSSPDISPVVLSTTTLIPHSLPPIDMLNINSLSVFLMTPDCLEPKKYSSVKPVSPNTDFFSVLTLYL